MINQNQDTHRSLSADTELSSAYDLLNNGEYGQCSRIIRKKLQKLKSPIDIANFEILNLQLLHRTKKSKEKLELLEKLKSDFLTKKELYENEHVSKYFKNLLRTFNEDKAAYEILKMQMKNKTLTNLSVEEQYDILKELTLNQEFVDMYSKVNTFLKYSNDNKKFLLLLKYEIIFYLFKLKKFSISMFKKMYTDLLNNQNELKDEKGYYDILGQYIIALNDFQKFNDIYINTNSNIKCNLPVDNLYLEFLYQNNNIYDLLNHIYNKIKNNYDEFIFEYFEKFINVFFFYIKQNKLKLSNNYIVTSNIVDNISQLDHPDNIFREFINLLEYIKKSNVLNTIKSAILGQLMMYHNLILYTNEYNDKIHSNILCLINNLLEKASKKQSILLELKHYFIYLNNEDRKNILNQYSYHLDLNNFVGINDNNFEQYLFYFKLNKLLNNNDSNIFGTILKCYKTYNSNNKENKKLDKGERLIVDDLIILLNEYYYENKYSKNVLLSLLNINIISHNNSPYNYDISIYLLKTYSELNMFTKTLDILKYMNLKGPQFETVSYIAFPSFIYYQSGLNYLIDNLDKWNRENKKDINKTLWKMFKGRNFWNSEELFTLLDINKNSYYNILINYLDSVHKLNEHYLNNNNENPNDYYNEINNMLDNFNQLIKKNELYKNQDIFISMPKYKYICYFDNKFEVLSKNENYDIIKYRYNIDKLNKDNILYRYIPGYQNNYFKCEDVSPFDLYDNYDYFLFKLFTTKILKYIKNYDDLKIYIDKLLDLAKQRNSEIDIIICELYNQLITINKSSNIVETFNNNFNLILSQFEKLGNIIFNKMNEYKKNIKYGNYDEIKVFINYFNDIKYYYIVQLSNISSNFIDIISEHKKEFKDAKELKMKLNEKFKTPFVNSIKEVESTIDNLIANVHKENVLKEGLNNINKELNANINENDIKLLFDLSFQIDEEHKAIFKDIKDSCKKLVDYIKQKN